MSKNPPTKLRVRCQFGLAREGAQCDQKAVAVKAWGKLKLALCKEHQ